jgi:natural product biosynthesis luciferase-like monooxygenase protein
MIRTQPASLSAVSSLVELVRRRATEQPDREAFTFVREVKGTETTWTYAELDLAARRIAAWLQSQNLCGQRVLIVFPQGLEYIAAFLGCLYAGSVAVPIYPPRLNRHLHRLGFVIKDAQPTVALTASALLSKIESSRAGAPELQSVRWCPVDEIPGDMANRWQSPIITERSIAFLQYTSGSTATPKGVMVTHANLVHNERMIQKAFGVTDTSVIVGWLPLYHDMGLIGNVLQPLWAGAHSILLSPTTFVRQPVKWLSAVSQYRGTISGGPNFAYDLCLKKITEEERASLDLSTWNVAFNGSEPIRWETVEQFAQTFSACGFRRQALFPCYGLAEATLFVSGGLREAGPQMHTLGESALEQNRVTPAREGTIHARTVVNCGSGQLEEKICIIDPQTLEPCAPDRVGEVWIAGPHVTMGYWNQPTATEQTFHAYTIQGEGPYLRTGDLGYLADGQLFITGRIKDLVIIRGRNHYPQDLEYTISRSHPFFELGTSVAFSIDVDGEPQLVLIHEGQDTDTRFNFESLTRTATRALAEEHGIQLHTFALAQAGALPKTSSGKICRQECRKKFLAEELKLLALTNEKVRAHKKSAVNGQEPPADLAEGTIQGQSMVESAVREMVATVLRVSPDHIDMATPLSAFGLDSLMANELKARVEGQWKIELELEDVIEGSSIESLAVKVLWETQRRHRSGCPIAPKQQAKQYPLSYGQRALSFLYKLAPDAAAYHIPVAALITSPMDISKLQAAFQILGDRHACLRTVMASENGDAVQRILDHQDVQLQIISAESSSKEDLNVRLTEESRRPFDLERGPLFRVSLFRRSELEHILLLVFHHIVIDFFSLTLLFEELKDLYLCLARGLEPNLTPLTNDYATFVDWQREMLASRRGTQLRQYWERQLQDKLPILRLPTDRPRPPVQRYKGATYPFKLGPSLAQSIFLVCRSKQVSVYTLLVAVFMVLLHRYTSQADIVIGSPVSGRTRSAWSGIVGYFINQIVLRAQLKGTAKFSDFLQQMKGTVAGALAHQDYPLALVAEHLHTERDPGYPPLFQVMFSWQQVGIGREGGLAGLALGQGGYPIKCGDLKLQSMDFSPNVTQLDLTLVMTQINDELIGSFQYNTDLFDQTTIAGMAQRFSTLLEHVVVNPECPIECVPFLSGEEQERVITEWNATAADYDRSLRIQDLFQQQAARTPNSTAVVWEGQELTYTELNQRANQVANYLMGEGVGPEMVVGLCMERSAAMVVAILGILKSGAAYLPIDPSHPDERIRYLLDDARAGWVVGQRSVARRLPSERIKVVCADDNPEIEAESKNTPSASTDSGHIAYVIYTSGSTGKPKGVMVSHCNVVNFFKGMDQAIQCGPSDTLLAVTGISFDISVLELLWTLTRGAKVILAADQLLTASVASLSPERATKELDYSLFYFASADGQQVDNKYRLLLDGARFADCHGFAAVWTPERHFHRFGGLYPNPSVTGAAVAAVTERVQIRAGSVVLPLHNVIRVAEEWSVVDNLSGGRAGIALASGWHADDFAFAPKHYTERKELTFQAVETFHRLWQGEAIKVISGSGKEIEVRIFPKPIQARLPVWITAAGAPDTFVRAGRIGASILTHLLGQTVEEVAQKIRLYRESLAQNGHDPQAGLVTLMLHTFLGENPSKVKEQVRGPFTEYLRSSVDLVKNLIRNMNLPLDLETISPTDLNDLLAFAFDRYFETSALFGSVKSCRSMVERLKEIGVNEIACLIDFGVENDATLASLHWINELKKVSGATARNRRRSVGELAMKYNPTLMQCTPAMMKMLTATTNTLAAFSSLRTLMLGGEVLPSALAREIKGALPCRLVNMYGPTETTIWSSTGEVTEVNGSIPIGRPISNTELYVVDRLYCQPVPAGLIGELYIGGEGVARGYLGRPDLTAERFIPNPFSNRHGSRLYRTGDLARYLSDGRIELLGRSDSQIKIRGVRIELGEIEAALLEHYDVREAAVVVPEHSGGDKRLVAYVVARSGAAITIADLRNFLRTKLPQAMVPSGYMFLEQLPLNANGKVNRQALPALETDGHSGVRYTAPSSAYEQMITTIWRRVLDVHRIGIDDNFFDLGGHSLRMVQVHRELLDTLGRELPLVKLLEHPTVRSLAEYLTKESSEEAIRADSARRAFKQKGGLLHQMQTFRNTRRDVR